MSGPASAPAEPPQSWAKQISILAAYRFTLPLTEHGHLQIHVVESVLGVHLARMAAYRPFLTAAPEQLAAVFHVAYGICRNYSTLEVAASSKTIRYSLDLPCPNQCLSILSCRNAEECPFPVLHLNLWHLTDDLEGEGSGAKPYSGRRAETSPRAPPASAHVGPLLVPAPERISRDKPQTHTHTHTHTQPVKHF